MIQDELKKSLQEAFKALSFEMDEILLEHPADMTYGEFSTNAAFSLSKKAKTPPKVLADKIVVELQKQNLPFIEKIEVAGAGFINFHLSKDFFADQVSEAIKSADTFGTSKIRAGQKVMVEYTDPNPFKEFHIGHLMPNVIGEAISRLIEAEGANIKRVCYQGDVGLHVAKALWYMMKTNPSSGVTGTYNAIEVFALGQAYAAGDLAYNSDESAKKEIIEINKKIYSIDPSENYEAFSVEGWYEYGRKTSLEYFEKIYKRLGTFHNKKEGTAFDNYFFESETGVFGREVVEKNTPDVFEKSDGAIVFKGDETKGLHTRVFINSQGLPTYEAKELGLAKIKYDWYPYDQSVVVTGNEINEYFKVLLAAMSKVFPELATKTLHISHGMLRLPTGKMSSRKGNVVTAEALIEDIKVMVTEKIKDRGYDKGLAEEITEKVAIGAIKYSILRQAIGGDIIFDFEKSISFEGDSGPYLQYALTRAKSLIEKGKEAGIFHSSSVLEKIPADWPTTPLEKLLYRFPEIVAHSAEDFAPHHLVTYLTELASAFNSFYAQEKIIESSEPASSYRLSLVSAFAVVMQNGLSLLGIPVPEKM